MLREGKMETARKGKFYIADIIAKPETMVALVLVLLCIVMTILRPDTFPTMRNFIGILRQAAPIAILAVGMGFVIITGGIDLSVGSVVAFSACVSLAVFQIFPWLPPIMVLLLCLGGGLLVGVINGLFISKVGIPPFIVTLGMMSIASGAALVISGGHLIRYEPTWISVFGRGDIGPFPVQVLVMLAVLFLSYIFANYTQMGRNIYAVGNSEQAAKLSGISVDRVIITVYGITGALAGLCALILIGQFNSAHPSYGNGWELQVIAAAVIGGISMKGGEGNILGVLLGALLISVLRNMFAQLAIAGFWQTIVLGSVIILAVAIDCIRKKRISH